MMKKIVKIIENVQKLYELRQVPQFLFLSGIHPNSMMKVREAIIKYLEENPDEKSIDFIIQSGGGSPADAYRIIRTLRANFENVNIVVPFWAKSAATLLSLGATNIIMDEFGEFGPLDIQIGVERDDSPEMDMESALNYEYSVRRIEARAQELYFQMFVNLYSNTDVKINKTELSNQLLKYLASFYEPLLSQINPYNLGKKKRLLDIGEQYAKRILITYNQDLGERERDYLVDYLVNGCPDHGYVIDYHIMNLFLKNIELSSQIGVEYEQALRNLTSNLLPLQGEEYIGFVTPKPISSKLSSQVNVENKKVVKQSTKQPIKKEAVKPVRKTIKSQS